MKEITFTSEAIVNGKRCRIKCKTSGLLAASALEACIIQDFKREAIRRGEREPIYVQLIKP